PVYSIKKERYTLTRRILFFRYKKTNRIQELQDTLWHTQKLLENTRREVSALRSEVKSATSKPRRFVVTEIER
ncbi:hypothetical protein, partial [Mailhella sp.]|uniref:hypothetical protein n=1 Tax=Mailhella sp. TaxID=1981029 RepID=UPI0040628C1E